MAGPGVHGSCQVNVGSKYTDEEIIFIRAMEHWMKINKVRFPKFTDVLAVAKSLGYCKVSGGVVSADWQRPHPPLTTHDSPLTRKGTHA